MKSVAANLLKPGMVFSAPVYIDESNLLVPAGILIRQKDLDKLKAWGIQNVMTDGVPSIGKADNAPLAAQPEKPASVPSAALTGSDNWGGKTDSVFSISEVQENSGAYRIYISLIEKMNIVFLRISKGENVYDSRYVNTIGTQLLQAVRTQRERFIGFILGGEVKGYEMAKSAVNIAILSALTAQEIKLPHHKILNVIIGALLHDAGMLRLPKEITEKRGGLSDAERLRMRSHPLLTQRIVIKEFSYHDEVGDIVLQHHERWDGDGYPYRTAGANVEIGARIVSIADAFEAMVTPKSYRPSIVGYQAMKNLLADNSRRFDPDILKAFILTMGIYPIGSIIRLNNGVVARISEVRASAPLRPKIQILLDEYKNTHKSEENLFIDLLLEKNLFIARAMEAKEIAELDA